MKKRIVIVATTLIIIFIAYIVFFPTRDQINVEDLGSKQYVSEFVERIRGSKTYGSFRGEAVNIAIVDSGIFSSHPDLEVNKENIINFIEDTFITEDAYGHGTQIAGIIDAKDNNRGIVGIAPNANLFYLKVLDEKGQAKIDTIIAALKWCASNNIDIINLSFSTKYRSDELENTINSLAKKGIIIVSSYSNLENTYDYPAEFKNVIGVKSLNNNKIKIENNIVFAPGMDIITTDNNGRYIKVSGNSFAAANVTGLVALILDKNEWRKEEVNQKNIKNELAKILK